MTTISTSSPPDNDDDDDDDDDEPEPSSVPTIQSANARPIRPGGIMIPIRGLCRGSLPPPPPPLGSNIPPPPPPPPTSMSPSPSPSPSRFFLRSFLSSPPPRLLLLPLSMGTCRRHRRVVGLISPDASSLPGTHSFRDADRNFDSAPRPSSSSAPVTRRCDDAAAAADDDDDIGTESDNR